MRLGCTCFGFFICSCNTISSFLIFLLSLYFYTQSLPHLRQLLYRRKDRFIPSWYQSVSCVFSHFVTSVSTLWPSYICGHQVLVSVLERDDIRLAPDQGRVRDVLTLFCYEIISHVNLSCDWHLAVASTNVCISSVSCSIRYLFTKT